MAAGKTLFTNATIITVNPQQTIWLDGAILVDGNRIAAIGKTESLLQDPLVSHPTTRIINCEVKLIIPGLINTHAHLGQSLLRGLAEDVSLHSWLCDYIWPLEANYEANDGYVASRLTIAEMLKAGTTCFLEALLTPRTGFDNAARAVDEMGIRACLVSRSMVNPQNSVYNIDYLTEKRRVNLSRLRRKIITACTILEIETLRACQLPPLSRRMTDIMARVMNDSMSGSRLARLEERPNQHTKPLEMPVLSTASISPCTAPNPQKISSSTAKSMGAAQQSFVIEQILSARIKALYWPTW